MQTERVTILMPPDKKAAFNALAAERGLSLGEFFRQAGDKLAAEEAEQEAELAMVAAEINAAFPRMIERMDAMSAKLQAVNAEVRQMLREKGYCE